MAHVMRHKISDKIRSLVSSASQESHVRVSGALARLGFHTHTGEEARAFARSDVLDYDYRHGMMMDEVKERGERDAMVEEGSHYQRHDTARKNSDSSEEQAAQDKPQISAWDAGWNVTNAIQVQLQHQHQHLLLLHTLLIYCSKSQQSSSAHSIYTTQINSLETKCSLISR